MTGRLDKLNHASIVEGCLLSPGKFLRFGHKDMVALERRIQTLDPEAGKLIGLMGAEPSSFRVAQPQ